LRIRFATSDLSGVLGADRLESLFGGQLFIAVEQNAVTDVSV
jgi:hypothetical protein